MAEALHIELQAKKEEKNQAGRAAQLAKDTGLNGLTAVQHCVLPALLGHKHDGALHVTQQH